MGFQETKLNDTDSIEVENYKLFYKNRSTHSRVKSGGIAVAVKRSLLAYISPIESSSQLIYWFKISKKLTKYKYDILCGVIYIPPENTRYSSSEPFVEIQNELDSLRHSFGHILLLGDLNSRTSKLNEYIETNHFLLNELHLDELKDVFDDELSYFEKFNISTQRTVSDGNTNTYGYKLIDFCKSNSLYLLNGRLGRDQLVGNNTCRNASCVDYFISSVNMFPYLKDLFVDEFCMLLSDVHNPVTLRLSYTQNTSLTTHSIETLDNDTDRIKLWDRNDPECFIENIDIVKISELESKIDFLSGRESVENCDIDYIATEIAMVFCNSAEKSYGKVSRMHNGHYKAKHKDNKPWFGKDCAKARLEFHKAKNCYDKSKSETNKSKLKSKGKIYKSTIHRHYRQFIRTKTNNLRSLKKSDPKLFWKQITGKNRSKIGVSVKSYYDFMKNLNICHSNNNNESINFDHEVFSQSNDINMPISINEIKLCVRKLANGKSNGLDQILNEHIKSTLHIMLPLYHKLFNLVFNTGIIPKSWTEGCIIPIYKNKGAYEKPENYRPITLLSCLGKLFTSVLNSRLQVFAREYDLIEENQTGFRKNYSTCDNIFSLQMLLSILTKRKKKLYCAFIDFEKAFDTVWRIGLWKKLIDSNIRGKCFRVIFNLYQNIKSCVLVNGVSSSFFPCTAGVRQGDNLSPFLFSIYLNDLEHFLRSNGVNGIDCATDISENDIYIYIKLFAFLYADDTALIAESELDLQHALNVFRIYCQTWKLRVNISKTKIVIFGKGRPRQGTTFYYEDSTIEIVKKFKYLGVYLTNSGSLYSTIKYNCEQANKALTVLLRKITHLNLSVDLQLDLFNTMIKPIILYASEIWGFNNIKILEKIQLRFLKSIFNMKSSTPNNMVYGEFGVFPLEIDIQTRMISFWVKLLDQNTTKLSNILYQIVYNSDVSKSSRWFLCIENILNKCGCSGFWNTQKVENPTWLVKSINQKLKDLFINDWYMNVENSSSFYTYRLFKHKFQLENYLLKLPYIMKKNFCLFRTRNHKLPIECGRWRNIDVSERKCHLCHSDVGDEFHFLLCCPSIATERRKYIDRYYYRRPNILKFDELMNTKNIRKLKNLCKFVKIILSFSSEY